MEGRCTFWRSGDPHHPACISAGAGTSCGFTARSAGAQEPLGAWWGATPGAQVPGSGAGPCAFSQARPRPLLGSAPPPIIPAGRLLDAEERSVKSSGSPPFRRSSPASSATPRLYGPDARPFVLAGGFIPREPMLGQPVGHTSPGYREHRRDLIRQPLDHRRCRQENGGPFANGDSKHHGGFAAHRAGAHPHIRCPTPNVRLLPSLALSNSAPAHGATLLYRVSLNRFLGRASPGDRSDASGALAKSHMAASSLRG